MGKFTAEEKLEAVLRYLSGKESYREIGKSISVVHKSIVNWAKQYEYNSVEAFLKPYTNYTQQFKLNALNFMIEHGTSLIETVAIFKITAPSSIRAWKKQFESQEWMPFNQRKRGDHP